MTAIKESIDIIAGAIEDGVEPPELTSDPKKLLRTALRTAQKKMADEDGIDIDEDNSNDWTGGDMRMPTFDYSGFIGEYIKYAEQRTDAPLEYHYACALNIISILSTRRRKIETMIQDVHTNLYITLLGDSTLSRKTACVGIMEDFLKKIYMCGIQKLPNSFSPESFIETMAENSQGYIINDECGAFLNQMKKSYMVDMKEILTLFYDGKGYKRTLKKGKDKNSEFIVNKPYLNIFFATTPQNFMSGCEAIDVRSGWLARFLYVFPQYRRQTRPISFASKQVLEKGIISKGLNLKHWLEDQHHDTIVEKSAQKMWQDWEMEIESEIVNHDDPIESAVAGRIIVSALKIALLHSISRQSNVVSTDDMQAAIEVCQNFFLPAGIQVLNNVENQNQIDRDARMIEKIIDRLKRRGGSTTRTDLLKATRLTLRPFTEIIETMVESGLIRAHYGDDKGERTKVVFSLLKN